MTRRTVLRAAVRAALAADPALAGVEVAPAWFQNLTDDDLPAVGVFTPREDVQRAAVGKLMRTVDLVVQYRLLGGEDIEAAMDSMAEEIERIALAAADPISDEIWPIGMDMDVDADGGRRIGKLNMNFRVVYLTG